MEKIKKKLKDKDLSYFNGNFVNFVTFAYSVNDFLCFDNLTEYGVYSV